MLYPKTPLRLLAIACAGFLASCGGDDDAPAAPPVAEEIRVHDLPRTGITYAPANAALTTFDPIGNGDTTTAATSRWTGMLNGAQYNIEVPQNWNGKLVMYAHGYGGDVGLLKVSPPQIRRHLIQNGYAWAASSYSKNFYDVRIGIEDTNALALEFTKIAAANSRPLTAPTKTYIIGVSMGGHIAGAAVEAETLATANHKVTYSGAVPMCGVLGDTELFDYLQASMLTAQALAGLPKYPTNAWRDISATVTSKLFTTFPTVPTADGIKYREVIKNLTGGARPMFEIGFGGSLSGFPGGYEGVVWNTFNDNNGTVNGIFTKSPVDTNRFVYKIDGDTASSDALNASVLKLTAAPDANRLRTDGLRWVPKLAGEVTVPVVTLHTLGDMYVPFSMEQIYRKRVDAKGNGGNVVQRAIRGVGHCDFTVAEQVEAFQAMTTWAEGGAKPAGDDVLTAATVAAPTYGCTFTRNTGLTTDEQPGTSTVRGFLAQNFPCPQ